MVEFLSDREWDTVPVIDGRRRIRTVIIPQFTPHAPYYTILGHLIAVNYNLSSAMIRYDLIRYSKQELIAATVEKL